MIFAAFDQKVLDCFLWHLVAVGACGGVRLFDVMKVFVEPDVTGM